MHGWGKTHPSSRGEMPLSGRLEMELVLPVLLSRAVPSAPCRESQLELLLWGPGEDRDPQHTGVPEQRCPEDARWEPCVSWLPAGESTDLPGAGSTSSPGWWEEGAAGELQSAGPGCGLSSQAMAEQGVPVWLWQRAGRGSAADTAGESVSGSGVGVHTQPRALSLLPRPCQPCLHGWMI